MIHKIIDFIVRHYLVFTYTAISVIFVLYVLFSKDLQFLVQLIAALAVIGLNMLMAGLLYIFVRAIFADKHFDKKSLRFILILAVFLVILYPVLKYVPYLKIDTADLNMIYLLAPLASWPAIIAVLLLNIYTKWGVRKEKKLAKKKQKTAQQHAYPVK